MDATNVHVRSDETLTTVVGVNDVIVVTTQDAVLVLNHEHGDKVKQLVDAAEAREPPRGGRAQAHLPALGLLSVDRRRPALSGQAHRREARRAAVAAKAFPPRRALDRGARHGGGRPRRRDASRARERVRSICRSAASTGSTNPGKIDLELIEVQTGSYLGEDDIVRFEDAYNRGMTGFGSRGVKAIRMDWRP